jgi:hypothetical protein
MNNFGKLLAGGDLRTIGDSNNVVKLVHNQKDFDELFALMFHANRLVVMRAADAIEKITIHFPQYLSKHKIEIFALSNVVKNKELQWHLALLLSRIRMDEDEFNAAWKILMHWAKDKGSSKIVRVNSIQSLFNLSKENKKAGTSFHQLITELGKEDVPSIKARIKKLKKV